jgi:hypothetical protein
MRLATSILALLLVLVMVDIAWAKGRPQPMSCPPDVALALEEACPCAGKMLGNGSVEPWRSHGQYVSCVVRLRNALRKGGCLTADLKRTVARCAAKSTCGKAEGTVVCCLTQPGTCSDPMPGDGTAAGVCSNDAEVACDADADCTKTLARVADDDAACTAAGGTSGGQGSVCTACLPPTP